MKNSVIISEHRNHNLYLQFSNKNNQDFLKKVIAPNRFPNRFPALYISFITANIC